MHIDWNGVKQRPHFFAEILEKQAGYAVQVMYRGSYVKKYLTINEFNFQNKPVKIFKLPCSSKFLSIFRINMLIERLLLAKNIKKSDLIYITHPSFYYSLKNIGNKLVIYDCMDDALAFQLPKNIKRVFEKYEKKLIKQTYLTIFSSEYLQKCVKKRTDFEFNSVVINNAVDIPTNNCGNSQHWDNVFKDKTKKIISYIGTISQWFDYELLNQITKVNDKIEFHLFGPSEVTFKHNKNIVFHGVQPHKDIFCIMEKSDALIMPFKVNELVKSVNPVKLYEYIYSNKPVIAVKYGETEKFADYVYLYEQNNVNDLEYILNILEKNNYTAKKPKKDAIRFAQSNTWENRVSQLLNFL
jgi:hypothetical protein